MKAGSEGRSEKEEVGTLGRPLVIGEQRLKQVWSEEVEMVCMRGGGSKWTWERLEDRNRNTLSFISDNCLFFPIVTADYYLNRELGNQRLERSADMVRFSRVLLE